MSLWDRIVIKGFKNCEVSSKNKPIGIYSPIDIVDPIDGKPQKNMRITVIDETDIQGSFCIEVDYEEGLSDLMSAIIRCDDGMVTVDDEIYEIDIRRVV